MKPLRPKKIAGSLLFLVASAALCVALGIQARIERDLEALVDAIGADVLLITNLTGDRLTSGDLQQLSELPCVKGIAGESPGSTFYTPGEEITLTWVSVSPNFLDVMGLQVAMGRGFVPVDQDVAVLGWEVKRTLFGDGNPVGLRVRGKTVIGVLAPIPAEDTCRHHLDSRVLIPIGTKVGGGDVFEVRSGFSRLVVRHEGAPERASLEISQALAGVNVVSASSRFEMMQSSERHVNRVLLISSIVLIALAGVSTSTLLLFSIASRTREIGTRRAIGARSSDILFQFAGEAAAISALGGVAGEGLALCLVACFPSDLAFSPIMFGILPGAILLGVVASAVTAWSASRLSPVVALSWRSLDSRRTGSALWIPVATGLAVAAAVCSLVLLANRVVGSQRLLAARWGDVPARLLAVAAPDLSILPPPQLGLHDEALLLESSDLTCVVPFGSGMVDGRIRAAWVPGSFRDLRFLRVVDGRDLAESDFGADTPGCLVSSTYASKYYGSKSPLERSLRIGDGSYQVVGVYDDSWIRPVLDAEIVLPLLDPTMMDTPRIGFLVRMRRGVPIETIKGQITTAFSETYPHQAEVSIIEVGATRATIAGIFQEIVVRMSMLLGGGLVIAVMHIALLSRFLVTQRSLELGIRRAVGATHRAIASFVAWRCAWATVPGAVVGVLVGELLSPPPTDLPATFWNEIGLLGAAVVLALAVAVPMGMAALLGWGFGKADPAVMLAKGRE